MTTKQKPTIGVLYGGLSSEREVSLITGAAVHAALKRLGYEAVSIDAGEDVVWQLREAQVDIAFIALHGRYGEDGCVQGALENAGIRYTGSGVMASAMAMDKGMTKIIAEHYGVATPAWTTISAAQYQQEGLPEAFAHGPVVIKPTAGGSSIGVSICMSDMQIAPAMELAFGESPTALVEQYVEGKLVTVGVIGDITLPTVEIETLDRFYDYQSKYTPGNSVYHVPARISSKAADAAKQIVKKVHDALGCRGATRSEVIVDEADNCWFIELNTIPGMTEMSLLPKAASAIGLSFDDLVLTVLAETFKPEELTP
jgi:D-alanine-D-alanine ligase